jgi:glutathionyl-hydroquinone reductase
MTTSAPPPAVPAGAYVRREAAFRDWVTADGSSGFRAEAGRYHLYVSDACPWSSRSMIVRRLKRLEDAVGMTVVDPVRDDRGWRFVQPDPINGFDFLAGAYRATDPGYAGRVTVPVLWDIESRRIVSNESAEVIQMLNCEWDEWGAAAVDFYPESLRGEIDTINERVYRQLNNGVYRAGFATAQGPYEEAYDDVFDCLDWLETRLATRRYLVGDGITLADWRLFPTLVRFDAVYYSHFKCNRRRIVDYPSLLAYLRDLYQHPGVAPTVNMDHIKRHYYVSHTSINPTRVVPKGPDIDFTVPHNRDRVGINTSG